MRPTLIYCADGNRRFAEIALRRGFEYGAQLPNTVYFTPYFTDQDWRGFAKAKTDERRTELRVAYLAELARYRPALATVLDWEREEQFDEVLSWAEEAAQFVQDSVIIIPKVVGGIPRIPRSVGGRSMRLGYSAASTFSGTPVSRSEFQGWPVHCLGGSPRIQMQVARELDCRSADGNYIQNLANRNCQFYSPGFRAKCHGWPTLRGAGLRVEWDAPYVAFELTCIAVPMAWDGYSGASIWEAQREWLKQEGIEPEAVQQPLLVR